MQLPQPGSTFEGKYAIRQTLGEGGFAMVYRATDNEIQRDVAIKILTPRDGSYPKKLVARFMREARVIASLQDPHTIKLFEFGESSEGLLYMVFQYVSGLDLQTIIHRRAPMSPDVVVHVITQVLSALTEAHAAGVLHRDIKPANVLIHEYMGDEYAVKLLDFGIAKVDEQQGGASLTKTGALLGTPKYMAPEQVFGEAIGPWSDIYSLGLVAFEMLVGEPAIRGTKEEMLRAQVSEEPIRLPYDVGWLSLRQAIERMVARSPEHRFHSAQEAHKAFRFATKFPNNGLPSGPLPAQSSISGPIAPLPYSSGTHLGPPGAFSSGLSTPNPAFSSGAFTPSPDFSSEGHWDTTSNEPPRRSNGIIAGSIALAVVVGGMAFYLSRTEQAVQPPQRHVPSALIAVQEPGKQDAGSPAAPEDFGEVDHPVEVAFDPALIPQKDGCGNAYAFQEERWIEVKTSMSQRSVQVFLPKKYKAKKRYPLILALQPASWDVKQYVNRAYLFKVNRSSHALVFGPEPGDRLKPWTHSDDIAVLKATVRTAAEQFCIDRTQIFVVGTGAGGRMARDLACEMPLSGVATTGDGELASAPSCTPDPPVPMLWILGKQDFFAPMKGGMGCAGGEFLSADDHDQLWRGRNGCGEQRERWLNRKGSECWAWDCADATYGACRAAGGHYLKKTSWDILDPAGCSAPVLSLPVGPAVWDFFESHGKRLEVPEIDD